MRAASLVNWGPPTLDQVYADTKGSMESKRSRAAPPQLGRLAPETAAALSTTDMDMILAGLVIRLVPKAH